MKRFLVLLLFLSSFTQSNAQIGFLDDLDYFIKGSIGYNNNFSSFNKGELTDYLLNDSEKTFFLPSIGGSLFYKEKYGLRVIAQIQNRDINESAREDSYWNKLEQEYGNDYHILSVVSSQDDYSNYYSRLLFGFAYKIKKNKLTFIPTFNIGYVEQTILSNTARLKAKNAHTIVTLEQIPNESNVTGFVYSPGATAAIHLSERTMLHLDANYIISNHEFKITEINTDLVTQVRNVRIIEYDEDAHNLYLGIGITYHIVTRSQNENSIGQ